MNRMHRVAAAVAGLSLMAAMLVPAAMTPGASQAAASMEPVMTAAPVGAAPAKPVLEGVDEERERQKCHLSFLPLVEHELKWVDLVKLQVIVDVDCRNEIGSVSLFAEGRLLEKLDDVFDREATLHGATIIDEEELERGFCVDVEVDSENGHETHWGQCFFDPDEVLEADGKDKKGYEE